jgi:hypothetical protein
MFSEGVREAQLLVHGGHAGGGRRPGQIKREGPPTHRYVGTIYLGAQARQQGWVDAMRAGARGLSFRLLELTVCQEIM